MKKILIMLFAAFLFTSITTYAQKGDKSKRPSQPATTTATVQGTVITIDYSTPSVKGRKIGAELEPKEGIVWRTGANEATVFEVSKDVTINGNALKAGKYGLFTIFNGKECIVIFNKTWEQWGAFEYKEAADALRVKVPVQTNSTFAEKFNITVDDKGKVVILWGDLAVDFVVKPS